MGIPEPITWGITGGIATKNAPIMLAPGSHIILDNVRQERLNEWRTRSGCSHDANDDMPGGLPLVCAQETPWGGIVGLARGAGVTTSGRSFSPDILPRWTTPPLLAINGSTSGQQSCAQLTPAVWSRTPVAPVNSNPPALCTNAEGGGYRLTAWWQDYAGTPGIGFALTSPAGASLDSSSQLDSEPFAIRPQAVYCSAANMLVLVWGSSADGHIRLRRWSTLTGLPVGGVSTISTTGKATTGGFVSALYYGGATITVAYCNATGVGQLDILEYNPATDAVTTTTHTGLDCANCMQLFPDPDATGRRFVALTSSVPEIHVVVLTGAGAVVTNDLVVAADCKNFAAVAYENGASWTVVFQTVALGLCAMKRRAGVLSPVAVLAGPAPGPGPLFTIATNGWREPGTDAMRYILASFGSTGDLQQTYYEMALEFENGSAAIKNWWTEPQARMLPLNAMTGYLARGGVPQVQRVGVDSFVTALPRITKFNFQQTNGDPWETAVDAWLVQYRNTTNYNKLNSSSGTQTATDAFLIAGNLLVTGTGRLLCALGASALPFIPTLQASIGAGSLNGAKKYGYGVTVRMPDESGNEWRSPMSTVATIKPNDTAPGCNTVTIQITLTPFENLTRKRIVDIWRTDGDGSTFKLLRTISGGITDTVSFTYVDATNDVDVGENYSAEAQTGLHPRFSHVAMWNDRMWGADADFPSKLWFTKPLSTGLLPEFIADALTGEEFSLDVTDEFKAITGLAPMDDKLVILKERAVYVLSGDGPDNAGNGSFPVVNRISSETGNIVGGPFVSTGREVYITSLGGVWTVGGGQGIDFTGAAIDKYLSMPLLQSPETVIGMVVSPGRNEARVQTTNYRFVHDRIFNVWERDTGGMSAGISFTKMLGGKTQAFFLANGQVWREDVDSSTPADAGTPYQGSIMSAWVRPNGPEGWIQLFRARALGEITAAGTVNQPALTVFYDNDDAIFESFQPTAQIAATQTTPIRADAQVRNQRCSTFKLKIDLPSGDALVRLDAWSAAVHVWPGMQPLPVAQKWGATIPAPPPPPPPPPAPSLIPVPTVGTKPVILTGVLTGDHLNNARQIFWQYKNHLLANGYAVIQSYDASGALPAPGVDSWTDYTKLKGTGGGGVGNSWIVLQNTTTGMQFCFEVIVTFAWLEVKILISPTVGFTGGTTMARPTASDQLLDMNAGYIFGTGPAGDQQFYAACWTDRAGNYARVAWIYGGHAKMCWAAENLAYAPAGWSKHYMLETWGWGNTDVTFVGNRQHLRAYALYWGSGGSFKGIVTPAPDTVVQPECALESTNSTWTPNVNTIPNGFSNQWIWIPPRGITKSLGAVNVNGFWGYVRDEWWLPNDSIDQFSDFDTMGDNDDFIIIGQRVLVWGIGAVSNYGLGLGVPSTRYGTSRFYGRNTL